MIPQYVKNKQNKSRVLWENSDISSSFEAQEINLLDGNYNSLEICFKDSNTIHFEKTNKGYGMRVSKIVGEGDKNLLSFRIRTVEYINPTKLLVGAGQMKNVNSNTAAEIYNTVLIPIKVIGYY